MRVTKRKIHFVFIVAITFVFGSVIIGYLDKYEQLRLEELGIYSEIEAETEKGRKLNEELEFNQSDAFVEKIARERLNMVMPDEILFYNDEK